MNQTLSVINSKHVPVFGAVAFLVSLTGNGFYVFLSFITLYIILSKTLTFKNTPILSFILFYHWLQIFAAIILANINNQDLDFVNEYTSKAVFLSLIGLVVMAFGFDFFLTKSKSKTSSIKLNEFVQSISSKKLVISYLLCVISSAFLMSLTRTFLGQFVWSIIDIKWIFYLLLVFKVGFEKKNWSVLIAITLFEFVSGFFTFFSSFKEVLLFLILGLFVTFEKITKKQVLFLGIFVSFFFCVFVVWTSIKGEYRSFVNKGSTTQMFDQSKADAGNKLGELFSNQTESSFKDGLNSLIYRIQYMENFSLVLNQVPSRIPYEDGGLWKSNLEFVFTPRFLNPNKGILDASAKSNKYTGVTYATAAQGTSISMGYFVECFIDFGEFGMFFPLISIALVMGYFYNKILACNSDNTLLDFAFVTVAFMPFYLMESDGIFYIGRLFFSISTYYSLKYFFGKKILKSISN